MLLQTNSGVVFQSDKGTVEEDYLDGGRGYQVIFRSRTRWTRCAYHPQEGTILK